MWKLSGKPRPDRTSRGTYRKGAMTSSQDTRESAIDIALDDITKHNVDVRHSEVSNHDAMEPEAQPERESRCAVNSSLPRGTTVALQECNSTRMCSYSIIDFLYIRFHRGLLLS